MVVAVALGDPPPRGVEVGVVLADVLDVVGGVVVTDRAPVLAQVERVEVAARARSTTRRTRSGRSSRRSRARAAPPVAGGSARRRHQVGVDRPLGVGAKPDRLRGVRRPEDVGRRPSDRHRVPVRVVPPAVNDWGTSAVRAAYDAPRGTARRRSRRPSPGATGRRRRTGRPAPPSPRACRPRRGRRPRSPGARRTDWWWWQGTSRSVADQTGDARVRAASRPRRGPNSPGAGAVVRRGRRRRGCAGRARPPARTAISCIPRQTPSTGSATRSAAVEQRGLPGVAVGAPVGRARVGLLAVATGVDVGAAADDQAVEPPDDRRRRAGRPPWRAAAAPARRPRPRRCRRTRGAAGRRAGTRPPRRPPPGRCSARSRAASTRRLAVTAGSRRRRRCRRRPGTCSRS